MNSDGNDDKKALQITENGESNEKKSDVTEKASTIVEDDKLIKRGWLQKRGQKVTNWKKRFFVLKDGALIYYENELDVKPKGQMNLFGAVVVSVNQSKVGKDNCIEISSPTRSLYLTAESRKGIKDWALAIQRVAVIASGQKLNLESEQLRSAQSNESKKLEEEKVDPSLSTALITASAANLAVSSQNGVVEDDSSSDDDENNNIVPVTTTTNNNIEQKNDNNNKTPEVVVNKKKDEMIFVDPYEAEEKQREAAIKKVNSELKLSNTEKSSGLATLNTVFAQDQAALNDRRLGVKAVRKQSNKWKAKDVKLRQSLPGHDDGVECLASDKDDNVVSGGTDGTVRLWNTKTMTELYKLTGHTAAIKSLAVAENTAASSAEDGSIRIWDLKKQKCITTFQTATGEAANALVLSSNGQILISASDVIIQVYDLKKKKLIGLEESGHDGRITSMALYGQTLFTGSEDHNIKVWDMCTFQCTLTMEGHNNWIFCMIVSYERQKLYTGADTLKVWDISSVYKNKMKCETTVDHAHESPSVQSVALTADERYLLSVSIDGFLKIWELNLKRKSKPLVSVENKTKFIFGVQVSDRRVFTCDHGGGIKVWE